MKAPEKATILLVDDIPANLLSLEVLLEDLNVICLKANSGHAALELLLEQQNLACILLDVNMPDMDGIETASLIRKDPALAHIPIMFVTAHKHAQEYRFKGYEAGAVDYLIKPLEAQIVISKVKVFLDLHEKHQTLLEQNRLLQRQQVELRASHQALQQSQLELEVQARALDRANQYKNIFLANMSHELRTPLNAILGSTQHLQQQETTAQQDKQIELIAHNGKRLLHMLNQVLQLSKLEAGQELLALSEMDLRRFLTRLHSQYHQAAQERALSFQISATTPLPVYILGDEDKIDQILKQLLDNALRFSTKTVRLELAFRVENSAQGQLNCAVIDSGPGIPEAEQQTIFEAFVQGQDVDKTEQHVGLGLSFAAQLVALMQGHLSLQSEVGQGSRFSFEIPLQFKGELQQYNFDRPTTPVLPQKKHLARSGLTEVWLQAMQQATENSEFDQMQDLISELRSSHKAHYQQLQQSLDQFDYQAILDALQQWQADK